MPPSQLRIIRVPTTSAGSPLNIVIVWESEKHNELQTIPSSWSTLFRIGEKNTYLEIKTLHKYPRNNNSSIKGERKQVDSSELLYINMRHRLYSDGIYIVDISKGRKEEDEECEWLVSSYKIPKASKAVQIWFTNTEIGWKKHPHNEKEENSIN